MLQSPPIDPCFARLMWRLPATSLPLGRHMVSNRNELLGLCGPPGDGDFRPKMCRESRCESRGDCDQPTFSIYSDYRSSPGVSIGRRPIFTHDVTFEEQTRRSVAGEKVKTEESFSTATELDIYGSRGPRVCQISESGEIDKYVPPSGSTHRPCPRA